MVVWGAAAAAGVSNWKREATMRGSRRAKRWRTWRSWRASSSRAATLCAPEGGGFRRRRNSSRTFVLSCLRAGSYGNRIAARCSDLYRPSTCALSPPAARFIVGFGPEERKNSIRPPRQTPKTRSRKRGTGNWEQGLGFGWCHLTLGHANKRIGQDRRRR